MIPITYGEMIVELANYLNERESIRIKKENGEPRPWTNDPILGHFKFTNVLREQDYTTQAFLSIYRENANASKWQKFRTAAVYRYFGTSEFANEVGFLSEWDPDWLYEKADAMVKQGKKIFTSAYVITNGGISAPKHEVVIGHYLKPLLSSISMAALITNGPHSFQTLAEEMYGYAGFGGTGFMTKEVLSDYALQTRSFDDAYSWSPVGPGALRGLAWVFPEFRLGANGGKMDSCAPKKDKAVRYLVQIGNDLNRYLAEATPKFGHGLDLHGIQFALCEFDKYCRTKYIGGKPKVIYQPRSV